VSKTPDIASALEDLLEAARKIEWSAGSKDWPQCACCHYPKHTKGHSSCCQLDRAIKFADRQLALLRAAEEMERQQLEAKEKAWAEREAVPA